MELCQRIPIASNKATTQRNLDTFSLCVSLSVYIKLPKLHVNAYKHIIRTKSNNSILKLPSVNRHFHNYTVYLMVNLPILFTFMTLLIISTQLLYIGYLLEIITLKSLKKKKTCYPTSVKNKTIALRSGAVSFPFGLLDHF